jgi:hypothetical protein
MTGAVERCGVESSVGAAAFDLKVFGRADLVHQVEANAGREDRAFHAGFRETTVCGPMGSTERSTNSECSQARRRMALMHRRRSRPVAARLALGPHGPVVQRMASQRPWSRPGDVAEEDDWEETAYEYSAPARLIADRLDIMGFTLDATEREFAAWRARHLEYDPEDDDSSFQFWSEGERELVESLSFADYVRQVGEVVTADLDLRDDLKKIEERFPSLCAILHKSDLLFGYHYADVDPRYAYGFWWKSIPQKPRSSLTTASWWRGLVRAG